MFAHLHKAAVVIFGYAHHAIGNAALGIASA
jgi:hypothetical protein